MTEKFLITVTVMFQNPREYRLCVEPGKRVQDVLQEIINQESPEIQRMFGQDILQIRTSQGRFLGMLDILTPRLLMEGCSLIVSWEQHTISRPMAELYGCPRAADVVGTVPESMLTIPQELHRRDY